MGLDCYFQRTDESPEEETFPQDINLVGGLYSYNGTDGSFRGGVYEDLFEHITSMSLYEDLSPDEVTIAAKCLGHWVNNQHSATNETAVGDSYGYPITFREMKDLTRLFEAASEQRMKLYAWW